MNISTRHLELEELRKNATTSAMKKNLDGKAMPVSMLDWAAKQRQLKEEARRKRQEATAGLRHFKGDNNLVEYNKLKKIKDDDRKYKDAATGGLQRYRGESIDEYNQRLKQMKIEELRRMEESEAALRGYRGQGIDVGNNNKKSIKRQGDGIVPDAYGGDGRSTAGADVTDRITKEEEAKARKEAEEKEAERIKQELVEDAKRKKAEADEMTKLRTEEEARIAAEEEAARVKAEEAARIAAEEEAHRLRAEEEARIAAEEEAARLKAEEEARIAAVEEAARLKAEEEARIAAEKEAARVIAEEEARVVAEQVAARIKAEEEARIAAEQEAARREADEEARIVAEQEAARIKAEEDARIAAKQEVARRKAEEEARVAAEKEAARLTEEMEKAMQNSGVRPTIGSVANLKQTLDKADDVLRIAAERRAARKWRTQTKSPSKNEVTTVDAESDATKKEDNERIQTHGKEAIIGKEESVAIMTDEDVAKEEKIAKDKEHFAKIEEAAIKKIKRDALTLADYNAQAASNNQPQLEQLDITFAFGIISSDLQNFYKRSLITYLVSVSMIVTNALKSCHHGKLNPRVKPYVICIRHDDDYESHNGTLRYIIHAFVPVFMIMGSEISSYVLDHVHHALREAVRDGSFIGLANRYENELPKVKIEMNQRAKETKEA